MRLYLTFILFICAATQFANAQKMATDLKFDQRPVKCEKKWVVFPAKQGEAKYGYGFIYLDEIAGFTFDFTGYFTVDNSGRYLVDTPKIKTSFYKYRLQREMPDVALVPASRFAEMGLPVEPRWLSIYYHGYTDTIAHNYRMGFNYNAAGDCNAALTFLEPLYKKKPDYPGLIFELAYAYNDLNQTDKSISILTGALKKDEKNARLYRELGYAYMKKKDAAHAIATYNQGISLAAGADDKSEMAYNLAMVYKDANNTDEYKNWMIKAKGFATPNSRLYNAITSQGF